MSEDERHLAAIMYTDIVGYTALTQSNEAQAMEVLERHNRLLRPFFPKFHGREVKALGDGFLVEFDNALDAVKCASEIQSYLHDYNLSSRDEWKIKLRIGIHLGDVIRKGGDVFGDAVNIASRIQPIAAPEGICVSEQVYYQVQNKFDLPMVFLGEKSLKNVTTPVEVYAVQMPWEQATKVATPSFATNRIAILPFTSFSPDPNDAFFADGITDEIISAAAGISGLKVISRTSVVGYKGTTKKVREIGKELEVGSILEGTFKKAGNRIRVTTQLINVADDEHLWAQNYDRNLDDIFEVQSDVAKQVADVLKVKILSSEKERIEKKPTESTTAYTLYLEGRFLWNKRGIEDMKKAAEYFRRAIKEDPDFALGHVGLADCILVLRGTWSVEIDPHLQSARLELDRALAIDPNLAEAHASRGLMLKDDCNLKEAESEYKKAIELKPSYAFAHMWYGQLLDNQLKRAEALVQAERAVELDPLSPVTNHNLGVAYFERGDYARALGILKRVVELHPGFAPSHAGLSWAYAKMKEYGEIEREVSSYCELVKTAFPLVDMASRTWVAFLNDDRQGVRTTLPEVEARLEETSWDAGLVADMHFYLGDIDEGFRWLERAFAKRKTDILGIRKDQFLDGVRTDPRYLDLLKRLGLDQTAKPA